MKKILFIYGTRPEAIKMTPLVLEFRRRPDAFQVEICLTGQHRQMLDQVNDFFGIRGDYDLNLMQQGQSLFGVTARCLTRLEDVLARSAPDLVFVQGDTTTAMVGALAAFYQQIPVAHLEAGLRSFDNYSPFPEEINRKIAGQIAAFHFAPTPRAAQNLALEHVAGAVHVVGNTVIDALRLCLDVLRRDGDEKPRESLSFLDLSQRILLVTGHRRESFGDGFRRICTAIGEIAARNRDLQIVYPVHLNPAVRKPVMSILGPVGNVHLIEPLDYPSLVWLMEKSHCVLTDSGGIQEEAPALGKPVLVMREVTERMEGIEAGTAVLTGTDSEKIVSSVERVLTDADLYGRMSTACNPYGDGFASGRIVDILAKAQ